MSIKKCTCCKIEKELNEFWFNKSNFNEIQTHNNLIEKFLNATSSNCGTPSRDADRRSWRTGRWASSVACSTSQLTRTFCRPPRM